MTMTPFGYVLTINGRDIHMRYATREHVAELVRLGKQHGKDVSVRIARSPLPEYA